MKRVFTFLAALAMALTADAQEASPFYTGACEVSTSETASVIVGNILCYNNRREFATGNKNSEITADVIADLQESTNLALGGTYAEDYYAIVLEVAEAGSYKVELDACHKQDERTLWLYQNADEIGSVPENGETDELVTYNLVGEKQMPITGGWNDYGLISFDVNLTEGVNFLKIVFDEKYGGNVGGIRISSNGTTAISTATKSATVSSEYYNLSGQAVSAKASGVVIKVDKKADGSITTKKIIK